MNLNYKGGLLFLLGVGSGITLSALYFKKKYEKIADEEIASVKEIYSQKHHMNPTSPPQILPVKAITADDIRSYKEIDSQTVNNIINSQGYSNGEEVTSAMGPHFISPDEFGENEDYDTISLTYYSGGDKAVIADENDEIIDPTDSVGSIDIIAEHLGDYEDDCIHVRNDAKQCDYEILRDFRSYDEVLTEKPYLQNDMNEG